MTELIESETGQGQLGPMSPRSPSPPHSEAMVLIFDFTKIVISSKIELWFVLEIGGFLKKFILF